MGWVGDYCVLILMGSAIGAPFLLSYALAKRLWFRRFCKWLDDDIGFGSSNFLGIMSVLSVFLGGGAIYLVLAVLMAFGITLPGCQ
jgi:hypothetical protein